MKLVTKARPTGSDDLFTGGSEVAPETEPQSWEELELQDPFTSADANLGTSSEVARELLGLDALRDRKSIEGAVRDAMLLDGVDITRDGSPVSPAAFVDMVLQHAADSGRAAVGAELGEVRIAKLTGVAEEDGMPLVRKAV